MKLKFVLCLLRVPSRYLVYTMDARKGERFHGSVWKVRDHVWHNNHLPQPFTTRAAAAQALAQ